MWDGVGGIAHDIGDAVVADIVVVLVVEEAVEKSWIRVLVRVRLSAPAANWDAESDAGRGHQYARSVGELDEEIRTVAEPKEGVLDRSWPMQEAEAKVLDLRPSATLACVVRGPASANCVGWQNVEHARVVQVDAILCEELRLAEFREDDVHLVCNLRSRNWALWSTQGSC